MEKGNLIEFRLQGERRLAVLDRPEGKKNWVVIDEQGQTRTLSPKQMSYCLDGQSYQPSDLGPFQSEVSSYLDPSSLEVAWELLSEDGESVAPPDLALLLFSDSTPAQCYAAHRLLSEDKIYFKQKGDRYEPRPATQVAELKHQLEAEAQRQQAWETFLERVQEALTGTAVDWEGGDRPHLEALERYATLGDEAPGRSAAHDVLSALNRPLSHPGAFALLVDLGLWTPHENLFLRRTQIPTHFSSKVLDVAQRCLTNCPPDTEPNRLDLTHLKVYTIDDASTQEIDDGLSLEFLDGDRQRLWVHIADPTRWLTPGDELDLEARRRCTTVYLPTGMTPMLPPELATGPMSLNSGQTCCALSFSIILNPDGSVEEFSIHPSLVKPTYRLTYDDVDEMLELGVRAEPEIIAIAEWAKTRHRWRQSQGSIFIDMPESAIKVKDDEVIIEVLDNSASRQLVAEMMILAGEVAARYAQEHNLAIPFRHQSQPELPPEEELMQLPAGPVRACAIRKCMPRSEMSVFPNRHASLGLDTYTQVTSPIRRYTDLLTHFQLKAHLRGDTQPFSSEQVQQLMMSVMVSAKEAVLVERQTCRYWAIEYLRRHGDETWQALMLRWIRPDDNLGSLLLEEIGIEFVWRFPRPMELGERFRVRVTYADPREDSIQFQEVVANPAQV
ncbi:RNB domain-containing ribonuclease [Geitlerinema sp. P-1104]|uniref:ribonuclease catalytic domain-containing protein n=1 Tax=Geitlerinema sp. P-1104 TaxID=2546230 RepID=UPI001476E861|nr:RNB domain-containing ribonuclease [Geitlerinema sp. P-1104]